MTTAQSTTGKRGRLFWVPAPQYFNLNQCCRVIHEAYPDNYGIYLVGSALVRRDYRDVDVRMILGDEDFAARFGSANRPDMNAAWSLTCSSIACWLSLQTGLPVDFQIQQMTSANEEFPRKDGFERHHLGLFTRPNPPDYSKDAPPQLMQPAALAKPKNCTCPDEHETHLVGCPCNCGHPECSSCDKPPAVDAGGAEVVATPEELSLDRPARVHPKLADALRAASPGAGEPAPQYELTEREEIEAIWGALEDLDNRLIKVAGLGKHGLSPIRKPASAGR